MGLSKRVGKKMRCSDMLASEACPYCRNRIEGKPTPTHIFSGVSSSNKLDEIPIPRWSFECSHCQHEWLAEPVSPSLMMARF